MSDSPSPYKKCCGSGSDLTIKSRIYILILYPCSEQVGVNQWSHICTSILYSFQQCGGGRRYIFHGGSLRNFQELHGDVVGEGGGGRRGGGEREGRLGEGEGGGRGGEERMKGWEVVGGGGRSR